MPQYVVGHEQKIRDLRSVLRSHPGLHLVSNYLTGVGIPDCIERALSTAEEILEMENR